jgi:hypothetical protein
MSQFAVKPGLKIRAYDPGPSLSIRMPRFSLLQHRHLRQSPAASQFSTRKARRVFHRLGRPSPSSVSTGILAG